VADALLAEAGIGLAWARPFFIYGPGQRPTSLIPTCLAALESGTRPAIRTPGAVNDFVHVADVAEAIALLAELPEARGPYNVGSGVPVQVGDVVNRICRLRDRPEAFPAASAGEAGMWADIGRIRSDTGWKPVVSLEEGIRDTIEAWKTDS
jgi:nucleoside-diphosphate-sugar epimerase